MFSKFGAFKQNGFQRAQTTRTATKSFKNALEKNKCVKSSVIKLTQLRMINRFLTVHGLRLTPQGQERAPAPGAQWGPAAGVWGRRVAGRRLLVTKHYTRAMNRQLVTTIVGRKYGDRTSDVVRQHTEIINLYLKHIESCESFLFFQYTSELQT